MSPKGRRKLIIVASAFAVVVIGCIASLVFARESIDRFVQDRLYDNVPSGVACKDLPTRAAVEKALADRADLVRRIEAVGGQPDIVLVHMDDTRCGNQDRAEILIVYPGHGERVKIEEILKSESFGVPVALRNV